MNFPQAPSPKGGLHTIIRMLSILLIQHALSPGIADANARSRLPQNFGGNPANETGPIPYLKITGALALRFHAPPPPPDPAVKPPAGAPPVPASAALPPPVAVQQPVVIAVAPAVTEPPAKSAAPTPPSPANPSINSSMAILPDDTRAATRAEDFLPFFQFPGANGDVTVPLASPRAPVPGALPPSSATYQQR